MALSPEKRAQMDAIIQAGQQSAAFVKQPTLTPERRAQMDALLKQQQVQSPPQQSGGGVGGFLKSVATPFIKAGGAVAGTVEGLGELGAAGLSAITGNKEQAQQHIQQAKQGVEQGGFIGRATGIQPIGANEESVGEFAKDVIGTGLEIGSYMAPIGQGAGLVKNITQQGLKAGVKSSLPAIGKAVATDALAGGIGGGGQALGTEGSTFGDVAKGTVLGAGAGAATGGLLRGLGAGTQALGAGAKKVLPQVADILAKPAGQTGDVLIEAFNNPEVQKWGRAARKEGGADVLVTALQDAKRGLDNFTSLNNKEYNAALKRITASTQDLSLATNDLRESIVRNAQENFGVRFGEGKKLNNLDFNASDVVEGTASVQRAFDRLFGEPITTVKEMDRVKKSLGRLGKGAPNGSPAQALIYQMKGEVDRVLKEKIPGYATEMKRYAAAANFQDELEKVLSLSDRASRDTAIRKLVSTTRNNNEYRRALLDSLSQEAGVDIFAKIAGSQMSSAAPRGLSGVAIGPLGIAGGILGIFNPATMPMVLMYLALSSPALLNEALGVLGKLKGKTISIPAKKELTRIFQQAVRVNAVDSKTESGSPEQGVQIPQSMR